MKTSIPRRFAVETPFLYPTKIFYLYYQGRLAVITPSVWILRRAARRCWK